METESFEYMLINKVTSFEYTVEVLSVKLIILEEKEKNKTYEIILLKPLNVTSVTIRLALSQY